MLDARLLIVPAVPLGAWIIVRGVRPRAGVGTVVLQLLVLAHLTAAVAVAFFPFPIQPELIQSRRAVQGVEVNLIPLASLIRAVATGTTPSVIDQSIGNVVMLMPVGVYVPLLVRRTRHAERIVLIGLALSLAIELGQLLISSLLGYTYKIAEVDDVVLNTGGVAIGFAGYLLISHWRPNLASRPVAAHGSQ
jgi:glycopeptide antibiotics resistance protein